MYIYIYVGWLRRDFTTVFVSEFSSLRTVGKRKHWLKWDEWRLQVAGGSNGEY
jgi:hypothetical protein